MIEDEDSCILGSKISIKMHFSRHERIALMMMLVPMHKVVPNLIKPRP